MKRKAIRRITADKKEKINRLAEILYNFLPLNSMSKSTVTFKSIFAESSLNYLEGHDNKKQALQKGLELLYRYHERLPRIIIRKVVPAAIEYRKYKRKPLTKKELEDLSICLQELDIDMSDELHAVYLDERLPRITIPPEELKKRLRQHDLDPAISSEPLDLFDNGHFNEAVRKSSERFEDRVREISSIQSSGRDLMGKAFNSDSYIILEGIEPENRNDFMDGYKLLTIGSMAAIRNIFSHGDEERRTPEECYEMLMFLNWLFRFLRTS